MKSSILGSTSLKWQERAACRDSDPDLFFQGRTKEARQICQGCPVRNTCLEFAVVGNEKYGVWGGTTPHHRKKIRKHYLETGEIDVNQG